MKISRVLRQNSLVVITVFGLIALFLVGGFLFVSSSDTVDNEEDPRFTIEGATQQSLTVASNGGPVNGGIQVRVPIKNETFTQNFTPNEVQRNEFFTVEFQRNLSNISDIGTVQVFKTKNGELESSINSVTLANIGE